MAREPEEWIPPEPFRSQSREARVLAQERDRLVRSRSVAKDTLLNLPVSVPMFDGEELYRAAPPPLPQTRNYDSVSFHFVYMKGFCDLWCRNNVHNLYKKTEEMKKFDCYAICRIEKSQGDIYKRLRTKQFGTHQTGEILIQQLESLTHVLPVQVNLGQRVARQGS